MRERERERGSGRSKLVFYAQSTGTVIYEGEVWVGVEQAECLNGKCMEASFSLRQVDNIGHTVNTFN